MVSRNAVVVIAAALMLPACASNAPSLDRRLLEAQAAVSAATLACGDNCPFEHGARAVGKLRVAERLVAAGDEKHARWLIEQAQVDAEVLVAMAAGRSLARPASAALAQRVPP